MPFVAPRTPPLNAAPALQIADLTITAGGIRLVQNLSLVVRPGERMALLGASGSGKSLTATAVLGALGPEFAVSGSIRLFGVEVNPQRAAAGSPGREPGTVAAIYQDSLSALNPLIPVGPQLTIPLRRRERIGRAEAAARARDLLASVGIDDPERALAGYAAELSGGQRQRVCIALALACRARLLVADEPTTALDVVTQARVLDVLRRPNDEAPATMLFITHDLAVAASLCDHVTVLQQGRVVEQSTMADLIDHPRHGYSQALVQAAS